MSGYYEIDSAADIINERAPSGAPNHIKEARKVAVALERAVNQAGNPDIKVSGDTLQIWRKGQPKPDEVRLQISGTSIGALGSIAFVSKLVWDADAGRYPPDAAAQLLTEILSELDRLDQP